jgi:hypothetical protein
VRRIADCIGQRIGALGCAIDDDQLADTGIEQRERARSRRAAGAEQQAAPAAQVERMAFGQVTHEAGAVGVVRQASGRRAGT